jgi:hypothetical protein
MAYRGKFNPKNLNKYEGDWRRIEYRSLWERQVFRFCDDNDAIVRWSSEEVVVPYRCKTDNRVHRYFVDLKITFKNGDTYLVEIKPKKRATKSKGYLTEVLKYVKNISKWESADEYAKQRGWKFEVWTEETIRGMGIKLLT